ncbi:hypothetical protein FRB90_009239 [Tulasnella sp. 427]|nr:hypothetical protein FRB90_009239 [Tulasnella sp. 427]
MEAPTKSTINTGTKKATSGFCSVAQRSDFTEAFSQVMTDMMSSTKPVAKVPGDADLPDTGIMDSIPILHLDDSAEDFAHVLDFIYPNSLPLVRTEHLRVRELMGIVRIAGKFCIDDLLEWAVERLTDNYLLERSTASVMDSETDLYENPEFCVEVIRFSRECSLHQFLPLALYALATTEWDRKPGVASCMEQLDPEDRRRVHEGHVALTKEVLRRMGTLPDQLDRRGNCLILHPLEELENPIDFTDPDLCEACVQCVRDRAQSISDGLLDDLAEIFNLDPDGAEKDKCYFNLAMTQTINLHSLPFELRSHIAMFLPGNSISNLIQTNQHLHSIYEQILYRQVNLRSQERHIDLRKNLPNAPSYPPLPGYPAILGALSLARNVNSFGISGVAWLDDTSPHMLAIQQCVGRWRLRRLRVYDS